MFLLEQLHWGGIPTCPYCGSTESTLLKREARHHCNACFTSYSVTVGTLFHQTHVDLHKWFQALKLVLDKQKTISVRQLSEEIGVNKNTAAYMIVRIYKAQNDESKLLQKLMQALN